MTILSSRGRAGPRVGMRTMGVLYLVLLLSSQALAATEGPKPGSAPASRKAQAAKPGKAATGKQPPSNTTADAEEDQVEAAFLGGLVTALWTAVKSKTVAAAGNYAFGLLKKLWTGKKVDKNCASVVDESVLTVSNAKNAEINGKNSEIGKLSGELQRQRDQVASLNSQLSKLKASPNLQKQLDTCKSQLTAAQNSEKTAKRNLQTCQSNKQELEGRVEELEGRVEELEGEVDDLNSQLEECGSGGEEDGNSGEDDVSYEDNGGECDCSQCGVEDSEEEDSEEYR